MLDEIQADLEAIADDPALAAETNYSLRAEAIETLEFQVIDRIAGLAQTTGWSSKLIALRQAAEKLKHRLEAIDAGLFQRLRADIRGGACRGAALLELIDTFVECGPDIEQTRGYDSLDSFLNGLLGITAVPAETIAPEPEMVAYQKTPARIMLRLIERAELMGRDVFYDLGSGLGHVPILAHLLSGAPARGVEVEPAYCAVARACAAGLGLQQVTFIQADARVADYVAGTVFFMYTPFEGRLLEEVLGRLREQTHGRAIRLITFGPCTPTVIRQAWLIREGGAAGAREDLGVFRSR
jgi:hypothetical protein